ncbi:hypothetical protein [Flavobacterium branchiophilum]|nr:hypothetical protein [Flavobacterium branchiophilum]
MVYLFGTKKILNNMNVFFIYILFTFFSCQVNKNEDNYILYKCFDEYQMKGLFKIDDIDNYQGRYFVKVLTTEDSIVLIKMQKKLITENKTIEKTIYFNKKGHWEILNKDKNSGNNKIFNEITYFHNKIIFNDTIYNYNYNLIKGKYAGGCITYSTKQKSFFCHDCGIDDIRNNFNIESAKKFIKECNNKEIFSKKYRKDGMFIYYEDGTISDVISFHFGYFDSDENLNESFIDGY